MIGWQAIRPTLIDVLTEIAADTTRSVEGFKGGWKEGQRGLISPIQKLELLLKITSVVGIGEDETRREMIDGVFTETQVGQRKFVLQVQLTTLEHTDEINAFAATERMRTRIGRPRIIQRLLDVDVAFHKCGPALPTPYKDKGRVIDCATMDITFGTVANDEDPVPAGWIEKVVITSHLRDTDGTELPREELNYTALEISGLP